VPPAEYQGSIYENQRATERGFFATASQTAPLAADQVLLPHRSRVRLAKGCLVDMPGKPQRCPDAPICVIKSSTMMADQIPLFSRFTPLFTRKNFTVPLLSGIRPLVLVKQTLKDADRIPQRPKIGCFPAFSP